MINPFPLEVSFLPRIGRIMWIIWVLDSSTQALRCLEGTTLSNRGQRPRIKLNEKPLPGGQYARGWVGLFGLCLASSSLQDLFLLSVVKDSKPLYILYNV